MSLKIILGRAGSGKTTYMLNKMTSDSNTVYLVPEQFSFSAEKMLINKFGVVGLGNPQVLSFLRLADMIFAKYGPLDFISDTASYEMLVSYCANSIEPERLRLFDGLVKKSELAETASSVITTFKKYCINAEKLEYAIKNTDDELLKKKLNGTYNKKVNITSYLDKEGYYTLTYTAQQLGKKLQSGIIKLPLSDIEFRTNKTNI